MRAGPSTAAGRFGKSYCDDNLHSNHDKPSRPLRTIYYTASSLDGFIATRDHSLDWLLRLGEPEGGSYPEFIRQVGALVMGSSTYEWILRHHLHPETGAPQPWPYEQPTRVFTTRDLPPMPGADVGFVRGDVRPVHQAMKEAAGDRNIWVVGGGDLAGQFLDAGLLDELIVQMAPVTLGSGMPLLPRAITDPPLRLRSATVQGVFVELRYGVPE